MNFFPIFLVLGLTVFQNHLVAGQVQTHVWLTVSPLANQTTQRNIEIHWRNAPQSNQNDWVGLFTSEPTDGSGAIKRVAVDSNSSGNFLTDVQFPYWNFPTGKLTQQCLGYFVGYVHNDKIVAKNCIKNNPFWMQNSLSVIGEQTLPAIMIPGTHDSGSYDKWTKESIHSFVKMFTMTQDESIFNQLVYGIRYLDMRVGYYDISGSNEKLWIVHGLYRNELSLRSAAEQVRDFLKSAPNEIVIFDFHLFVKGFIDENDSEIYRNRFKQFFEVISSVFKDLMVPFSLGYGVKINEMIRKNKRVLIGFDIDKRKYLVNEFLWPNVRHQWSEKDELEPLIKYFQDTLCSDNKFTLRSAMAEMTPTTQGVFALKYKSLRSMAEQTNSLYTNWFSDRWSDCANIVAADYFLGSNIVDIAISVNNKRHKHTQRFQGFY